MKKALIFTGGGSAGHVYPGLAVVGKLKEYCKLPIYWLGTKRGIEKQIVEKANIPFIAIPAGKLRRYLSIRNFIDIFNFLSNVGTFDK